MQNEINTDLITGKAIKIIATFQNGKKATYTTNILNLLLSDPELKEIKLKYNNQVIFKR